MVDFWHSWVDGSRDCIADREFAGDPGCGSESGGIVAIGMSNGEIRNRGWSVGKQIGGGVLIQGYSLKIDNRKASIPSKGQMINKMKEKQKMPCTKAGLTISFTRTTWSKS
jgi:hypothetical protein